jgi:hypothetical protein
VLRACVTSYRTREADVRALVHALGAARARVRDDAHRAAA